MPDSLPQPPRDPDSIQGLISEKAYFAILNTSSDAVVIADHSGVIVEFNRAAEKMFGFLRKDILGVAMGDAIVAPSLRDAFFDAFRSASRCPDSNDRAEFTIESLARRKDETEFPVRISVARIRNESVSLYVGFVRDLSHELLRELSTARIEWEACFNALPDNICILDTDGKIIRANHAMQQFFGGLHGDIKGKDYRLLYCGTENPDPPPPCAAVLNGAPPVSVETELTLHPGGKPGWYLVSSYPLRDLVGQQWGAISVVQDASERRWLQLEQGEFFRNSIDMLCVADLSGNLRLVSASFEQFFGLSNHEIFDKSISEFLLAEDAAAMMERLNSPNSATSVIRIRTRVRRNDGQERWLSWHISRANTARGVFCGVARDITEHLNGEAELIKAREIAEDSNRAKSEFLAVVSHEMRTPLHNIIGILELLRSSVPSGQSREWLDACQDSAEQLLSLISDILDTSRMEAGKLILEESDFNLCELFLKLMPQFQKRASDKGLSFQWTIALDTPVWWFGDSGKLRQIIVNLLTNAIKFTETGFVHIEVFADPVDSRFLCVRVVDSGIGIPANRTADVFRLFEQVKSNGNQRSGGVGLGLAICARLAELMNGDVQVATEEGQGSAFTAKCQLRPSISQTDNVGTLLRGRQTAVNRQKHIAVVEDDPVSARLAKNMLESDGYMVSVFADGLSLMAALSAMASGGIDAIVMDLMMPEMGGFETTQAIRESQSWFSTLPILATTANAMSHDAVTCLSHGMDGYLAKPFTRRGLVDLVSTHLSFARHCDVATPDEMLVGFKLKWDDLEESCNHDVAQIRELVEIIERTVPLQLSDLQGAVQNRDRERIRRAIHRLTGCLANICEGPIMDRLLAFGDLLQHTFGLDRISFQIPVVERTAIRIVQEVCHRMSDVVIKRS
jgi:PAS domain S-box-containing protein